MRFPMSLASGARIGVYEVVRALGAGGMGEVYLARDTVLNRHVALKVLPEAFVRDGERLARFEREAQLLASLNHANIAHGHGFEGTSGLRALVMELVEGDNLSDRIAQGPIRLADVLSIARQIADALEAAHEQGIVHRDRTDDIFSIQNVTRRCGASTSTSAESRRASTRRSGSRARRALDSCGEAKMQLFDYIEVFYNQRRRHSSLGQISPAAFERRADAA